MSRAVLVVDDSHTVRADLEDAFASAGIEVACAESLDAARRAIARRRWGLIVLDVLLPDGNGLNLLKELRSEPTTAAIPVVVLTTETDAADCLAVLGVYPEAFLGKPYDRDALVGLARRKLAPERRGDLGPRPPAGDAPAAQPGARLLLVEDSLTFREGLSRRLREDGHDVVAVGCGEEALDRLEQGDRYEAILMDVTMPGLGGVETCRRVKATPAWCDVPVILLTGHDDAASIVHGFEAGADDYISKGSEVPVFRARLAAHVRRHRLEQQTRRLTEEQVRREAAEQARRARELAELRASHLARLERERAELERADRELTRVARVVANELLPSLQAIGEQLAPIAAAAPARARIGEVRDRLADLLGAAAGADGEPSDRTDRTEVSGERLVRQALERLAPAIERAAARVEIEGELPTVPGREEELARVLEGLIHNAITFRGEQPPRVSVSARRQGRSWLFSVRDNGAGIAPEAIGRLFRSPRGRAGPLEGTGLAACARIIDAHGGKIWVESAPGEGSTFRFTIAAAPGGS